MTRERTLAIALFAATAISLYLCFALVRPFVPALAWALALAVIASPVHDRVSRWIRNPSVAAGVSVAVVAVILVGPAIYVTQSVVGEVIRNVEGIRADVEAGRWRAIVDANPRLAAPVRWIEENLDAQSVEGATGYLATWVSSFVTGSLWVATELLVTLFSLFFLFRDRCRGLEVLRSLLPLSPLEADRIIVRVRNTIHATVFGTLVVATVQGTLGGLMFLWLGLPAPVLWGTVMGLLAIVPLLGAFVVWLPAAVVLALQGEWTSALVLTAWGTLVVSLIDNLIYPILVGKEMRMHTLPVFFAIVGGVMYFGSSGLVLGPMVLAVTLALLDIWRRRTLDGRAADDEAADEPATGAEIPEPTGVAT